MVLGAVIRRRLLAAYICWRKTLKMKKKGFRKVIALAVIVLGSANLFGWSAEGHEAVATIGL
jgi:hypothetical protein